ncbi:group I intron-associated PD-(D/E)XK endonuclease [uncultured Jatrophihabitans sp.]|uniref:group I intron-associated PD-(D/E)XK endonuclease n=1 Tax=uncultured Jatrophihabitans sp. TaxID=1610747 RepID=UPI0035CC1601
MGTRRYSDEQLIAAVAAAQSWRGVLRALDLNDSSAGSLRAARRRADQLGVPYDHLTGQRRWSDAQLSAAVDNAASWSEVAIRVGRTPDGGALASLRTHALRRGLDITHLEPRQLTPDAHPAVELTRLRTAAPMLAAAWFTVRGYAVCWPLEPQRYDLLVERGAQIQRVQVKTTTWRDDGSYAVSITNSRSAGRVSYSQGEIDCFFVVDGELNAYLLPTADVVGRQRLSLQAYAVFKVMTAGNVLAEPPASANAS